MPEQALAGSPRRPDRRPGAVVVGAGALSARQRAALVLRYYEDLPDHQIAALLGCREASVRTLASRGLAVLRQLAVPAAIGEEESAVSGIEDIVRQVMASHDQEAPGAPDLLRALRLRRGLPGAREVVWPVRAPRRRRRGTCVVAASLAIGAAFHGHPPAGPGPAARSHPSLAALRPAALRPAALDQVPRYFAALALTTPVQVIGVEAVVVRSTLTGRVPATSPRPGPTGSSPG